MVERTSSQKNNNYYNNDKKKNNNTMIDCCGRFQAELCHPPFAQDEVTGHRIHGSQTFAPSGWGIVILKTLLVAWISSSLIDGILETDPAYFYFAYLTHWTLLLSVLYLVTSLYHSIRTTSCHNNDNHESDRVSCSYNVAWTLFAIAAPAELVVSLGYWGLEWDGSSDAFYYRNIMVHLVVVLVVWFDGLVLNRIPLRLGHWLLLLAYSCLYLLWTAIYELVGIGNPTTDEGDDLYIALQWKDDFWGTAQTAALLVFVVSPFAFLITWCLSLYSCPCDCTGSNRRYIDPNNNNNNSTHQNGGSSASTSVHANGKDFAPVDGPDFVEINALKDGQIV